MINIKKLFFINTKIKIILLLVVDFSSYYIIFNFINIPIKESLIYYLIWLVTSFIFSIYKYVNRFISYKYIIKLIKSIFVTTIVFLLFNQLNLISSLILSCFLFATHLFTRILIISIYKILFIKNLPKESILIYGANERSINLCNYLENQGYTIIGYVDNIFNKRYLNNLEIHNIRDILKYKLNEYTIFIYYDDFLINKNFLISNINYLKIKIVEIYKNFGNGIFRKITPEDIISDPKIDINICSSFYNNKSILITGAGGTIGSNLVDLISKYNPKKIYAIDNSEYSLFLLEKKLKNFEFIDFILLDVTNELFLRNFFSNNDINIVIHAAAFKHVSIVEKNHIFALYNNILSTKLLVDLSDEFKIENFTLVSSDKAVNPKSLMGFSKRISELYVVSKKSNFTKNSAVRFGNVLGSSGSVFHLFCEQINNNLPITVTDKNMTRFFMSVTEAVFLITYSTMISKTSSNVLASPLPTSYH